MNIALNKPVHSNLNNKNAYKVTDGNNDTYWEGIFFPCYVEIDLLDTYDINKIMLYFKDNMAFTILYMAVMTIEIMIVSIKIIVIPKRMITISLP